MAAVCFSNRMWMRSTSWPSATSRAGEWRSTSAGPPSCMLKLLVGGTGSPYTTWPCTTSMDLVVGGVYVWGGGHGGAMYNLAVYNEHGLGGRWGGVCVCVGRGH